MPRPEAKQAPIALGYDVHQCSGLDQVHGSLENCIPRSWLFTFTNGSDEMTARCYLLSRDYSSQGWYPKFDRVVKLSTPFNSPSSKA
jgi:hypothetical protein